VQAVEVGVNKKQIAKFEEKDALRRTLKRIWGALARNEPDPQDSNDISDIRCICCSIVIHEYLR